MKACLANGHCEGSSGTVHYLKFEIIKKRKRKKGKIKACFFLIVCEGLK